jgi:hypothetical protein
MQLREDFRNKNDKFHKNNTVLSTGPLGDKMEFLGVSAKPGLAQYVAGFTGLPLRRIPDLTADDNSSSRLA